MRTSLASACVNLEESQDATPSLQSERFADALGSGYPARFGRSEPRIVAGLNAVVARGHIFLVIGDGQRRALGIA